jgi:hypothetical protein
VPWRSDWGGEVTTPKRLLELCLGDDAERIAEAWLVRRNHECANDAPSMLAALDPESAWRMTLPLLSLAADDEAVADVGGGPLSELLVEHGDRFVDRAEALARSSPGSPRPFSRCGSSTVTRRSASD